MATELPERFIKLTSDQAALALRDAYWKVTGKKPSSNVLSLLLAQTALETGHWTLPNYNWGGVKATSGDEFFQYLDCGEILNGKEQKWTAEDRAPECKFAAYQSAADGAEKYIRTLMRRAHWWNGLHTETPSGFIEGLTTRPAYFTASSKKYEDAVSRLFSQYSDLGDLYGSQSDANFFDHFSENLETIRRLVVTGSIPRDKFLKLGMLHRLQNYWEKHS